MRLPHDQEAIARLRSPTHESPWRVLISGCLVGMACGIDGTDYGMGGTMAGFFAHPLIHPCPFCPEDAGLGTPRSLPDIHGGDGFDVLEGRARVLDESHEDLTEGMITGGEAMLAFAVEENVDFAVLTDMSAACGSQVISDGGRLVLPRQYQRGVGVATALLLRHGIPVLSQRDHRTVEALWARIDPDRPGKRRRDHHESDWYLEHFGTQPDG